MGVSDRIWSVLPTDTGRSSVSQAMPGCSRMRSGSQGTLQVFGIENINPRSSSWFDGMVAAITGIWRDDSR
jgi:hypothetical protein